jgi:SsrA-binding protein
MTKKISVENRKAYHDYFVEETLECGIVLKGNEVKSIRDGKVSIKESWISINGGQLEVKKLHVSAWGTANKYDIDETRDKKLLAHKREINELETKSKAKGYTLVPLKMYFTEDGKVKLLIGLCKGKHDYDKRNCLKERQIRREIAWILKE